MISDVELERTERAVDVAYSIPLIDDVEDYIWESIWSYVKDLPELDGLTRKKRLFDVVDIQRRIGWSAKTLVLVSGEMTPGREFEFVIQRADIIKKREALGFPELSLDDDPQILGSALLAHWRQKIYLDSQFQGVEDFRMSILLKDKARRNFIVMDEVLEVPNDNDIVWNWSDDKRAGLQGRDAVDNKVRYKWYHRQTQFFERLQIPDTARTFSSSWRKISLKSLIEKVD